MSFVTIITSKWFETTEPYILHLPCPNLQSVQDLFKLNDDLQEVILTDCVSELYAEDIQEIVQKKTLQTSLEGVYYFSRTMQYEGKGNSWKEIFDRIKTNEFRKEE